MKMGNAPSHAGIARVGLDVDRSVSVTRVVDDGAPQKTVIGVASRAMLRDLRPGTSLIAIEVHVGRAYPDCLVAADIEQAWPTLRCPGADLNHGGRVIAALSRRVRQDGKIGWILLWLLGVPIPILLLLFALRGCT
jgi:hypothetical protein